MRKQVIYFVRHGETELNAKGIRQGPDGPLSPKGIGQVKETSKMFPKKRGKPKVIISSPFQRTRETADIIAKELNMKVEYCDLLIERRNPSEIVGHSGEERGTRSIVDLIDKSYHVDDLRYSDEENFADLKARAKALLKYISKRREKQIIMVTHGIFLKMVASYILEGDKLSASEYNKLSYLNNMDNAGLTICTREPRLFRRSKWEILVWNNTPKNMDQNI
ncbi:MAG: histidine phosphatase family protein [Candidatus Pacebacteria bacterium]|nr:histidine phosphatase family protein [Candidatus Paceibacterota bacterium]